MLDVIRMSLMLLLMMQAQFDKFVRGAIFSRKSSMAVVTCRR